MTASTAFISLIGVESLRAADTSAIQTQGLRKVYGRRTAVRSLTLEVPRGAVFGFLGPNGAGKTTTMRILLGLAAPSEGCARVLGQAPGDVAVRRKIGFLPEHFSFYDWLTGSELLRFHGRLYGMSPASLRQRVPALLELVGLGEHSEKRLKHFSKGMLQRIGLAQALLNDPELVFLDEPTSGLDPVGRRLVRDIIKAQRERGATVFLNSHLLSEVEITCDRVAFIKHGEVLETRDLRGAGLEATRVCLRARKLSEAAINGLSSWASAVQVEGERLTFTINDTEVLPQVLRFLVGLGVDIYEVTPQRTSLEEMFLQIVGTDGGL